MDRDTEIEAFKQSIDLRSYAEAHGFVEDRRASSASCSGLRNETTGEKILVFMGQGDHWLFQAVRPHGLTGSIVDLDQHFHGGTLGDVRKRLRPWVDGLANAPAPPPSRPKRLEPVTLDLEAVRTSLSAAQSVYGLDGVHAYLNQQRGLTPALLAQERFRGRVLIDHYGNAVFPHVNADKQICGAELKNTSFNGFTKASSKGIWLSAGRDSDQRLVVAEASIDALSYAQLFDDGKTRYASIGGQLSPQQPGILHKVFRALPPGSEIVLAFDHDDGGRSLADYIQPVFDSVAGSGGRADLSMRLHHPDAPGADWNDELHRQLAEQGHRPTPGPA